MKSPSFHEVTLLGRVIELDRNSPRDHFVMHPDLLGELLDGPRKDVFAKTAKRDLEITIDHIKGWLAVQESPFFLLTTRGGQSVFQVMHPATGNPTVKEVCYLIHRGDGLAPAGWSTGQMPSDDSVRNDGNGWLVGSVVLLPEADASAIRAKLTDRISDMEKLLAPAEATA
jgi:hypothetical protein